jgi:hypothetical protein
VWSASTDGYQPEAYDYITRARIQFDDALVTFRAIKEQAGRSPMGATGKG